MYVHAKMMPVETVPRIRGRGVAERSGRVNSSMIYLKHCMNLCKCYNVLPPTTTKKDSVGYVVVANSLSLLLSLLFYGTGI
jgi:hypothetical protein